VKQESNSTRKNETTNSRNVADDLLSSHIKRDLGVNDMTDSVNVFAKVV